MEMVENVEGLKIRKCRMGRDEGKGGKGQRVRVYHGFWWCW